MNITTTKGRIAQAFGLTVAALCLSASTGNAGLSTTSELLDINTRLSNKGGGSSRLDYNGISLRTGQEVGYFGSSSAYNDSSQGTYVKGYFGVSDSETGNEINAQWFANEPDSIKRNDRGATISQSSYIGIFVNMYNSGSSTSTSRSAFVEDCSAKAKVKYTIDEREERIDAKATASLKCPRSTWEELGFDDQQIAQIEEMLKSPKVKFSYKGEDPRGIRPIIDERELIRVRSVRD